MLAAATCATLLCGSLFALGPVSFQDDDRAPIHGQRADSLLIKNVVVIPGNGNPPTGPTDVLVRGNVIERIASLGDRASADTVIDGTGKTLIPGLVNMHGHLQESRGRWPMALEYQTSLWLACGITTIRDVGSDFARAREIRQQSAAGTLACPRVFLYPFVSARRTPDDMRAFIRELYEGGADGLKIYSLHRDLLEAAMDEAANLGLRATTHIGVEETDARDAVRLGMTSIEHWYGIPDAALDGIQRFPPGFSYSNELDRFRWAGRLWREAVPERLDEVLHSMVEAGVAWDPTLAIYEACRDVVRARNKPWFEDHLHPALERFFEPNLQSHGSFFLGWTNTDEVYWKENYRLWMAAVRRFASLGGTVTTGEDAGFIYVMHGFGLLRELELHEEAGFTPLEVVQHATHNGARVLGQDHRIGWIREGWLADFALVDGNPLENLRLLYPTGTDVYVEGERQQGGAIDWTVKDGIPYHVETLMERVRTIVREAREEYRENGW